MKGYFIRKGVFCARDKECLLFRLIKENDFEVQGPFKNKAEAERAWNLYMSQQKVAK